jgi:hypothetical protein
MCFGTVQHCAQLLLLVCAGSGTERGLASARAWHQLGRPALAPVTGRPIRVPPRQTVDPSSIQVITCCEGQHGQESDQFVHGADGAGRQSEQSELSVLAV